MTPLSSPLLGVSCIYTQLRNENTSNKKILKMEIAHVRRVHVLYIADSI